MAPKTPKARRARSSASASSSSASASYVSGHDNPTKSDDPVQPSSTADFLAQAAYKRMATLLTLMTSNAPARLVKTLMLEIAAEKHFTKERRTRSRVHRAYHAHEDDFNYSISGRGQ